MNGLFEELELEGAGLGAEWENDGFDFLDDDDEMGDFYGDYMDYEESIKSIRPPARSSVKQAAKAATVVAKATGGTKLAKKVAKKLAKPQVQAKEMELGETEEFGEFEDEFSAFGGDWDVLGRMAQAAEMAAEAETEDEADRWIGAIASLAGPLISSLLSESESYESWDGFGGEWEDEDDYYALYEDGEGDQFLPIIGALGSLAAPLIKKGIGALGRFALSSGKSAVRNFAHSVPKIVARTGMSLARQAAAGYPVSPTQIGTTLAQNTFRHMSNPWQGQMASRTNRVLARRACRRPYRGYRQGYGYRPTYQRPTYYP